MDTLSIREATKARIMSGLKSRLAHEILIRDRNMTVDEIQGVIKEYLREIDRPLELAEPTVTIGEGGRFDVTFEVPADWLTEPDTDK